MAVAKRKEEERYTVSDWLEFPEDTRCELIDGVLYNMAPPVMKHQLIMQRVLRAFDNFIDQKGGNCIPIMSPVGVQLDRDDATMLEPDLIVVCDPKRFQEADGKYLVGEPDFVLEVLSPSTRKRDMTLKLQRYERAGVREYWIIDPDKEVIITYTFGDGPDPTIYTFADTVPVAIYDGALSIDFPEIKEYLIKVAGV